MDAELRQDDVKASLLQTDEGFRQLVSEHQDLDERIRHLSSLSHVSDEQRFEEIALKKRKLALKDRIQAMMRSRNGDDTLAMPSQ